MDLVAILLVIMLGIMVVFQAALVIGLPCGKMAWGGQHTGKLPNNLRIASAISALFFIFCILVVLSYSEANDLIPLGFSKYFLWFLTAYFVLGIFMNALSRSKLERLWAPYITLMLILSMLLLL